ncbi:hypothetical protein L6452_34910 [Arctium lappa]|uniref:Uncharacterized protein n=1 Tax=Arctium lappa TaxID=4217 RepID=A0ACB8YJK2_ARCLA|nr:hypothetical protein L6452_34910 [Arctium lappa]
MDENPPVLFKGEYDAWKNQFIDFIDKHALRDFIRISMREGSMTTPKNVFNLIKDNGGSEEKELPLPLDMYSDKQRKRFEADNSKKATGKLLWEHIEKIETGPKLSSRVKFLEFENSKLKEKISTLEAQIQKLDSVENNEKVNDLESTDADLQKKISDVEKKMAKERSEFEIDKKAFTSEFEKVIIQEREKFAKDKKAIEQKNTRFFKEISGQRNDAEKGFEEERNFLETEIRKLTVKQSELSESALKDQKAKSEFKKEIDQLVKERDNFPSKIKELEKIVSKVVVTEQTTPESQIHTHRNNSADFKKTASSSHLKHIVQIHIEEEEEEEEEEKVTKNKNWSGKRNQLKLRRKTRKERKRVSFSMPVSEALLDYADPEVTPVVNECLESERDLDLASEDEACNESESSSIPSASSLKDGDEETESDSVGGSTDGDKDDDGDDPHDGDDDVHVETAKSVDDTEIVEVPDDESAEFVETQTDILGDVDAFAPFYGAATMEVEEQRQVDSILDAVIGEIRGNEGDKVENVEKKSEREGKEHGESERVYTRTYMYKRSTTSSAPSHVLRIDAQDISSPLMHSHTQATHSISSQQEIVSIFHGDIAQRLPGSHSENQGIENREHLPRFSTSFHSQSSLVPFELPIVIPRSHFLTATIKILRDPIGTTVVAPQSGLQGSVGSSVIDTSLPMMNTGHAIDSSVLMKTVNLSDTGVTNSDFVSKEIFYGALKAVEIRIMEKVEKEVVSSKSSVSEDIRDGFIRGSEDNIRALKTFSLKMVLKTFLKYQNR